MSNLVPRNNKHIVRQQIPTCPQCGKNIYSHRDAIIVVDPYRNKKEGYCNECYELEKATLDLETDVGLHAHRWEFNKHYWWCSICNKRVNHPQDESVYMQRKPSMYLGMDKYKKVEHKITPKPETTLSLKQKIWKWLCSIGKKLFIN